ncbi:Outer membrane lipoprotein carrier protein LolA [uncultured Candidatus Thioglobus sp.]|nr:Outer membrane lipoprotein carrier protein LolA [uncultured Candidatus Thioglobus sp.]
MNKLLAALFVCYSSYAQADTFSQFFNSFETLSADFTQQTISESGSLLNHNSGYLLFKRPQQFIWQIETPNQQTLLLNDNQLWLIDSELEQASQRDINSIKNTPLYWLLNRDKHLRKRPEYSHTQADIDWYITQQKSKLSFGFIDEKLHAISLINPLNQTIVVRFSAVVLNTDIAENAFKLNLPKDFDVIHIQKINNTI